ncbi:hypothetical protein ACF64W_13265, partial [Clostridium perfringens]
FFFLIFAMIISINIILHSLEVFNKIVSLGTIIVIFIIAFYGLNNSIQGFEILLNPIFLCVIFKNIKFDINARPIAKRFLSS